MATITSLRQIITSWHPKTGPITIKIDVIINLISPNGDPKYFKTVDVAQMTFHTAPSLSHLDDLIRSLLTLNDIDFLVGSDRTKAYEYLVEISADKQICYFIHSSDIIELQNGTRIIFQRCGNYEDDF